MWVCLVQDSKLGQWGEIIGAVAAGAMADDQQQPGPTGAPSGPGPAELATPGMVTAISPTFQQAFTPQISPTIQVTTDSPGARIGATTVQRAGGGQYAAGGGAGMPGDGIPSGAGPGGMPITPLTPPTFRDEFFYPADAVQEVMQVAPFNWTPVIYVVGGLVAVMVFLQATKTRPPRRAP